MNDDSIVKIMQTLGMDYNPAIDSTVKFQKTVADLNKDLTTMKDTANQVVKDVNSVVSSQLGQMNATTVREMNKLFANIERQSKPIELKVETDKAELKMQEFANSMGIKLDKNLREQFTGLADGVMGGMDESKFNELANNISRVYDVAMQKQQKMTDASAMANTDDMKIYEYMKSSTIRLDESTIAAKTNVDGFSHALKNLTKQSETSGSSLDQMAQEMESIYNIKDFGVASDDIAERIQKAIANVREFKNGFQDLNSSVSSSDIDNFVKEELAGMIVSLGSIQHETKETAKSFEEVNSVRMDTLKEDVKGLGVVTTKTFKDMNDEVYKYIDTYKDLEKGIKISDTYMKDQSGKLNFTGRIVDDKSVEVTYKSLQKAHTEALKLNKAFDDTILKNQQMAKDDHWKKQFQSVTATSDEMKKLNEHYSDLEKQGKANIKTIQQSNLEQMKTKAAAIEQRATAKGLSQEYIEQSRIAREKISLIQSQLQIEGKLTAEEVRQTQELEEQLRIMNSQSKTDVHDMPPGNDYQNKSSWFTDSAKFYAVSKGAKEATGTIKDVEMGMIEIARIMDDTSFVFNDYRDNLLQLGVDYGQTFENVQAIALRWAQSGYDVSDSLELTETSLLALNTAELDATNATESMIGIMAQWNLEASDMALVMDKVNITADNYSVTSQDLVDGLLRSSGAAKTMGMSLEDTIATLTILRETSGRTGSEIGNALNSVLSYIQRPKSVDMMESLGIRMFADEAKTEFRDVMEIFDELAKKWNDPSLSDGAKDALMAGAEQAGLFSEELANVVGVQEEFTEMTEKATEAQAQFTDIEKRDAAQAAAGVHRRNYFIGLLERFTETQGVLNNMVDAGGYSMEENAATMETLEKKQEALKTSTEALAVAIGDAGLHGALKGLADGATGAVNGINNLPKPMKDLLLTSTSLFTAVKTLGWGMKTFGIQVPGVSQVITSLTTGTWSLTEAFKAGASGIGAFVKANGPLLALSAVVGGIMAVTNAVKNQREEMEKSIGVMKEQADSYGEVNDLASSYEELATKSSLTTEEQEKLLDIKRQIADLLPESKKAIDDESLSLAEQLKIIKELNEAELEGAKSTARKTLEKHEDNYDDYKKRIEEATRVKEEQEAIYDELYRKRHNLTKEEQEQMRISRLLMDAQSEVMEVYGVKVQSVDIAQQLLNGTLGEVTENLEEVKNALVGFEDIESLTEALGELEGVEDLLDSLEGFENLEDILGAPAEVIAEIVEKLRELGIISEETGDKVRDSLGDSFTQSSGSLEELTEIFEDATSKIQLYNGFLDELNSKEGLSAQSKQDMITKYQEFLPYVDDEIALREFLIDTIAAEEQAQAEAYLNMIMGSEDYFNSKIKGNADLVNKLNEYYGVDISNAQNLAGAKAQIENQLIKELSRAWGDYFKATADGISASSELIGQLVTTGNAHLLPNLNGQISEANRRLKAFSNIVYSGAGVNFSGINTSKIPKRGSSSAKKPSKGSSGGSKPKKTSGGGSSASKKEEYKAEYDRYTKVNLELEKNNNLLAKNKALQETAKDGTFAKMRLIQEQIKLEKEHQKILNDKLNLQIRERNQQEALLKKQGFKFSGSGHNMQITNLENIKGKSKEVEEAFNKFNDLQFKTIPGLQVEIMKMANAIESALSEGFTQQVRIDNNVKENEHLLTINKINQDREKDANKRVLLMKEEIKLIERKAYLSRGQANLARSEREEIEKTLKAQGFKFEGAGDDRKIVNPQKLKGQVKEIEELFSRYNEIQIDILPSLNIDGEGFRDEVNKVKDAIKDALIDSMFEASDKEIADYNYTIERSQHNREGNQRKDSYWQVSTRETELEALEGRYSTEYNKGWEYLNEANKYDKDSEQYEKLKAKSEEYFRASRASELELSELREKLHQSRLQHIDEELQASNDAQDDIRYQIDMLKETEIDKRLSLSQELAEEAGKANAILSNTLNDMRETLKVTLWNTDEWHNLNNSIKEYEQRIKDSNLELKQMKENIVFIAKEQANLSFDKTLESLEKSIFGGKTEDKVREDFEHKLYLEGKYIEGLEKELEISKIKKYVEQENLSLTKEQYDILNSSGKIERASLERMTKQLEIQELQNRLANLKNQKTVQSMVQKDDGTFDFEYVADQDAIYQTEQDLADKKADLIKWERDYQNEQERKSIEDKSKYLSNISDMIKEALEGDYETVEEFYEALDKLNGAFIGKMDGDAYTAVWLGIINGASSMFEEFGATYEGFLDTSKKAYDEYTNKAKDDSRKNNKEDLKTLKVHYSDKEKLTKKELEKEKKALEDYYRDKEKSMKKELEKEKKTLDDHFRDIKKLSDDSMETLSDTFRKGWGEIDSIVSSHIGNMRRSYESFLDKLKEPLPSPEAPESDGVDGLNIARFSSGGETQDFNRFTTYIPDLLKGINVFSNLVPNISTPELPSLARVDDVTGSSSPPQQTIHNHISKIELPNVRDGKDVENAILNLPRIIIQNG